MVLLMGGRVLENEPRREERFKKKVIVNPSADTHYFALLRLGIKLPTA